jgi:hypothetical protein
MAACPRNVGPSGARGCLPDGWRGEAGRPAGCSTVAARFRLSFPACAAIGSRRSGGRTARRAAAALLLLAAFSLTIAIAIARGRQVECRCFGRLTSGLVSWRTLARNIVLAALALAVLLANFGTPPPSLLDAVTKLQGTELVAWVVGLGSLSLIALGAWGFAHLLRAHGRLLLRIEAVEHRLIGAGLGDLIEASTGPREGLASGALAPPMTAEDVEGRPVSWSDLLQSGPALLLFTSPRCGACRDLPHEIKAWRQRFAGQLRLVLVSDGTAEEVRREGTDFGLPDVLVDRDLRLFHAFEAKGTPSAVLVQDNGTVGSSLASGQPAIMALLARQAAHDEDASGEASEIVAAPGAVLPGLPLRRLDGGSSTVGDLVREPTVVLFWNPGCGYCRSMRDDLRRWERRQLPRPCAAVGHSVVRERGKHSSRGLRGRSVSGSRLRTRASRRHWRHTGGAARGCGEPCCVGAGRWTPRRSRARDRKLPCL